MKIMCFGFIFLFLNDLRRPSFFFFFFLRKLSQNGRRFSQEKHDGFLLQTARSWDRDERLGTAGTHCVVIG